MASAVNIILPCRAFLSASQHQMAPNHPKAISYQINRSEPPTTMAAFIDGTCAIPVVRAALLCMHSQTKAQGFSHSTDCASDNSPPPPSTA